MLNAHDLLFPKNYVCIVASEPNLCSAFLRNVIDFTSYSASLRPLSI